MITKARHNDRIGSFQINTVFILMSIWAFYLFDVEIFKELTHFFIFLKINSVQMIPWKFILSLFVFAPFLLFLSFVIFSASPGQLLLKVKEVDARTGRSLDFSQAFILAFTFIPSFILCLLPYAVSYFHPKRQSLFQILASTLSITEKAPRKEINPLIPGSISVFAAFIAFVYVLGFAFNKVGVYKVGILIGGTKSDRLAYIQKLHEPKSAVTHKTPEEAFNHLKEALVARDMEVFLESLTLKSKATLIPLLSSGIDPFEDFPDDVEWIRVEMHPDGQSGDVYYYEIFKGYRDDIEIKIRFEKEQGVWKADLLSVLMKEKL